MPTYAYRCTHCNLEFEAFQSIKAEPGAECPKCKARTTMRLISGGGGLLFKGQGFYLTDNRSESYKEGAKKDEAAQAPECGKGACGACSVPAAATPESAAKN